MSQQNRCRRASGVISKEAFIAASLPDQPALFKDPRTARTRIYANESAKKVLEDLIAQAGITGSAFVEAGAGGRAVRPTA